ncbi:MAG: pyroglutamyl-peptidase I [Geminicoccales bacterium]
MLLTGFEGYGGRAINPAKEIAERLDGRVIGGTAVHGRILPVSYAEVGARLAGLIEALRPRAVIGLGLWPGEPMLRIERIAANIADFEIADNVGLIAREPVVEGGPAGLLSTLPIAAIRDRLLAAGIPARLSGTAGQFLCNALMYHALRLCAERSPPPCCGFIHLPYLPQQVALLMAQKRDPASVEVEARADLASMALEAMLEGVRLAIETTLEAGPA